MGTTAQKINYAINSTNDIALGINNIGGTITPATPLGDFKNELNAIYNDLPKATGEGTSFSLEDTRKGKMIIQPKGNTLQKTSILPEAYQQVDYIESTGTQYIDTGVKCLQTTTFEITNNFNILNEIQLFGAFANSKRMHYGMNSSQIYMPTVTNGTTTEHIFNGDTQYHTYYLSTSQYKYDNTIVASGNFEFPTDFNFFLFARNNEGTVTNYCKSRLKKAKIYNNNVLICDFIPCYRKSDNEIGLYDLVNDVFYTNQGTGTFAKGNDVPNPDYPQEIKNVTGENSVGIRGKNLFNLALLSQEENYNTYDESTGLWATSSNGGYYRSIFYSRTGGEDNRDITKIIKLKPNTNYTVKFYDFTNHTVSTNVFLSYAFYDSNGVFISQNRVNSTILTITSPDQECWLDLRRIDNSGYFTFSKIQIEEGSTATSYEPYITPVEKELNLGNIELCKIGNYQDLIFKNEPNNPNYDSNLVENAWYVKKNIDKYVFSSNDDIRKNEPNNDNSTLYYIPNLLSEAVSNTDLYCNRLYYKTLAKLFDDNEEGIRIHNDNGLTYFNVKLENNTVAGVKNWISNNIFELYFPLKTPTYTQITESTLVNQLEELYNYINTNTGTLIIETESEEENAQLIVNASALASFENS